MEWQSSRLPGQVPTEAMFSLAWSQHRQSHIPVLGPPRQAVSANYSVEPYLPSLLPRFRYCSSGLPRSYPRMLSFASHPRMLPLSGDSAGPCAPTLRPCLACEPLFLPRKEQPPRRDWGARRSTLPLSEGAAQCTDRWAGSNTHALRVQPGTSQLLQ
jgi:hypothetical protein